MLIYIHTALQNLVQKSDPGQDLAEYAILIGLIALLVVISITLIGGELNDIFIAIATAFGASV